MTYDEFLAWAGEDIHAEWVDGEVIVFLTPKTIHARLMLFLATVLSAYVERLDLGVVLPPIAMRIRDGCSLREPDIIFLAREHLDRITPNHIEGPADLIIEIVSDDSVRRDRIDKLADYAAAGAPEYWVIDPTQHGRQALFYQLTPEGTYREMPLDADGRYHSAAVRGFWFKPEWLWQDPLPDAVRLVATIQQAERS